MDDTTDGETSLPCFCGNPASSDGWLVLSCDVCGRFCHGECAGVTAALAPMLNDLEYTCPICRGSSAEDAKSEAISTRAALPPQPPPPANRPAASARINPAEPLPRPPKVAKGLDLSKGADESPALPVAAEAEDDEENDVEALDDDGIVQLQAQEIEVHMPHVPLHVPCSRRPSGRT